MTVGWVERAMRHLKLSPVHADVRSEHSRNLEAAVLTSRLTMADAAKHYDDSRISLAIASMQAAEHISNIGIAAQGVVEAVAAKRGRS